MSYVNEHIFSFNAYTLFVGWQRSIWWLLIIKNLFSLFLKVLS